MDRGPAQTRVGAVGDCGSMIQDETGELARQRDDLQRILDAIPGFVFYKDVNNRILRVNRAVAESLGVQADDMVNTETSRWYPDEARRYYEDDLSVIAMGQPKLGIVELLDTGQGKRWISTDKFPQRDRDGQIIGIVVIAQDITERRRLEEELLQSQKLDSLGRLAGGVAHDFNNLLTAILGHVELAQGGVQPESASWRHLDVIRMAAERSADLTRQLLAFARKQVIAPRILDLNVLVLQAEVLLRRVFPETVALQVTHGAGPFWVNADPGQMLQVLMNLVLNARDATPPGGGVTLLVDNVFVALPGEGNIPAAPYVVLTISDSGHGISDEAKRHLFEPFFTTKEMGAGTGLGLAVCYGIVKQNRGHITVTSDATRGTVFQVFLPRIDAPLATDVIPAAVRPVARTGGQTILLTEDEQILRHMADSVLSEAGYRVLAAANGAEALALARAHDGEIHLVITDVVMPVLDGVALAAEFQKIRPGVPILLMSGYAEDLPMANNALKGTALLKKPFLPSELLLRVADLLAR